MPRVAVIMPSFNHEKYVAEAIQSVLDQTYQDFELVITDDGSTDHTVDEIRKFTDPRIRLFTFEKNQGAAIASSNNLAHTEAEYLAMLSSDDAFMPDKLEKQVKFLDEHPDVWAVFTYAQIIDENGDDFRDANHFYYQIFDQPNRSRFEWLNHFFYKGNCLCHPSVLARRECYTKLGPPDPRYAQLGDFNRWIRVCLKHEIHVVAEKLVKFRVRADEANVSSARPEAQRRTYVEYCRILRNFLEVETAEDLRRIFPEASRYGREIERDLIPFLIAKLALDFEHPYPLHRNFAIQVLFDLLGNRDIAEKLDRKCGFGYRDFLKLTGQYDLFNIQRVADREEELARRDAELARRDAELARRDAELAYQGEQLAYLERYYGQLRFRLAEQANRLLRKVPGVHLLAKQSAEIASGALGKRER